MNSPKGRRRSANLLVPMIGSECASLEIQHSRVTHEGKEISLSRLNMKGSNSKERSQDQASINEMPSDNRARPGTKASKSPLFVVSGNSHDWNGGGSTDITLIG
jgi:hypothetical protein